MRNPDLPKSRRDRSANGSPRTAHARSCAAGRHELADARAATRASGSCSTRGFRGHAGTHRRTVLLGRRWVGTAVPVLLGCGLSHTQVPHQTKFRRSLDSTGPVPRVCGVCWSPCVQRGSHAEATKSPNLRAHVGPPMQASAAPRTRPGRPSPKMPRAGGGVVDPDRHVVATGPGVTGGSRTRDLGWRRRQRCRSDQRKKGYGPAGGRGDPESGSRAPRHGAEARCRHMGIVAPRHSDVDGAENSCPPYWFWPMLMSPTFDPAAADSKQFRGSRRTAVKAGRAGQNVGLKKGD